MKKKFLLLFSFTVFFASSNAQNDQDLLSQKFIEAKSSFEIVQGTEAETPVTFQKITLFKHPIVISNKYYDAFVFKSSKGGYLYWSFRMDGRYLGGWYMLKYTTNSSWSFLTDSTHFDSLSVPESVTQKEKKNINYFSDFSYDANALLFTMGQNSVPRLDANSEYIIWFEAKTKDFPSEGVPTIVSINLLEENVISVKQFFANYFTLHN